MTEAARMLGKATREVRRMTEGLPEMILDEEDQSQVPEWRRTVAGPSSSRQKPEEIGPPSDGPVAFKSGAEPEISVSTDENGVDVPRPAAPVDGSVAFEAGAGPTKPASSGEQSSEDESEPDAPPERDAK
jgi:hypothetical protein